jgi:hypothetical protein
MYKSIGTKVKEAIDNGGSIDRRRGGRRGRKKRELCEINTRTVLGG